MIIASSADTLLLGISTTVGLAGGLGVAYTVFRSSSEQRLREVDQRLINDQNLLIQRLETESSTIRTDLAKVQQSAETYRESLTQRAAVDHLAEMVIGEEKSRQAEHNAQMKVLQQILDQLEVVSLLLKDVVAQLKGQRGTIG